MADVLFHALNVGVVDEKHLHRVDLAKMRLAAETQTNLIPRTTGPAFFRQGMKYLGTVKSSAHCRLIPFIAGASASYILELTSGYMRVLDTATDTYITRATVTSVVTNGDFSSSAGWTLNAATISGGLLTLECDAHGERATCVRTMTVVETGVEHGLTIVVTRGPVMFRLGTTSGGDDLIEECTLETGTHSLAFTPNGATAYPYFFSEDRYDCIVDSITVEAAGAMTIATPWSDDNNWTLAYDQSLDVMFCAVSGVRQQKIERRGTGSSAGRSWSVVDYRVDDGPFTAGRTQIVTLDPSATEGDITITASSAFFKSTHVGALFKLWHQGQVFTTNIRGLNQYTDTFQVDGITEVNFEERKYTYTISGTWVGTIKNFRSFDGEDIGFKPVRREQSSAVINITANATFTNDDNDDNVLAWYKLGFSAYTSGEATVALTYEGGGGYGIARVTAFASSTSVSARVIIPFKGDSATDDWQEGMWSSRLGFPAGVSLADGRLWWAGNDGIWASISDAYGSFDEEFSGDAGPINRSIALGGRNEARWILTLGRLMVGCDSRIAAVGASSLEEVITAANVNVKHVDTAPAAAIPPAELRNDRGLYVSDSLASIYELSYSNDTGRYQATQFSLLTETLFTSGITGIVPQSFPDQRVWITTETGDAIVVLYEPLMDIVAAIPIATATGDIIEAVCSVPGPVQDRLYAVVKRTVSGGTVRYLEKLGLDSQAAPGNVCYCMDSYVAETVAHAAIITGLTHLEGRTVVAWVDGDSVDETTGVAKTFTVSGGQITLPAAPTLGYCVGLPYRARYKSARLAYGAEGTSPFMKNKNLAGIGLLLSNMARSGVQYGGYFDDADHPLMSLPAISAATGTTATEIVSGLAADEDILSIETANQNDPRLCIELNSPKPATIRAIVMSLT